MEVKIWGCRGSVPAPLLPQQIEDKIVQAIHQMPAIDTGDWAAVQAYVQNLDILSRQTAGGNTTCVQIEAGGKTFIIDAGTGIRELGLELNERSLRPWKRESCTSFLAHAHWDHIQGFPFFNPAYVAGNRIFIYGVHDLNKALVEQQQFLQLSPCRCRP